MLLGGQETHRANYTRFKGLLQGHKSLGEQGPGRSQGSKLRVKNLHLSQLDLCRCLWEPLPSEGLVRIWNLCLPPPPTLSLFLKSTQSHWKIRVMTGDEYRRQLKQEKNRVCTSDYILLHSENRKIWFLRRNTRHITTIYRRKTMKK